MINTIDGSYLGFGRRLYEERKKAHMTQERLAELLYVTPTHIHYLLVGRNEMQADLNITIFGLSVKQRHALMEILSCHGEKLT